MTALFYILAGLCFCGGFVNMILDRPLAMIWSIVMFIVWMGAAAWWSGAIG